MPCLPCIWRLIGGWKVQALAKSARSPDDQRPVAAPHDDDGARRRWAAYLAAVYDVGEVSQPFRESQFLCRRHVAVQPRDRVDRIGGPPQFGHVVERVAHDAVGGWRRGRDGPGRPRSQRRPAPSWSRPWPRARKGYCRRSRPPASEEGPPPEAATDPFDLPLSGTRSRRSGPRRSLLLSGPGGTRSPSVPHRRASCCGETRSPASETRAKSPINKGFYGQVGAGMWAERIRSPAARSSAPTFDRRWSSAGRSWTRGRRSAVVEKPVPSRTA
jgi:hypothetical protein